MGLDATRPELREPDLYNEFWSIPELIISNTDYNWNITTAGMTQTITYETSDAAIYNVTWSESDLEDMWKKMSEAYDKWVPDRSKNELDDLDVPDGVTDVLLG